MYAKPNYRKIVADVRSINPIGAGLIFAAAWIAGFIGSFAALLIVAAFLVGLFAVKAAGPIAVKPADELVVSIGGVEQAAVPVAPAVLNPFAAAGLAINRLEFKAPTAARNGRATK